MNALVAMESATCRFRAVRDGAGAVRCPSGTENPTGEPMFAACPIPSFHRLLAPQLLLVSVLLLACVQEGRAQHWRLSAGYHPQIIGLNYAKNSGYDGTIAPLSKGMMHVELERYLMYRFYVAGDVEFLIHNQQTMLTGGPINFQQANLGALVGLQWPKTGIYAGVRGGRFWNVRFKGRTGSSGTSWISPEGPLDRWTTAVTAGMKYYLFHFLRARLELTKTYHLPDPMVPGSDGNEIPAVQTASFNPYSIRIGISISLPWHSKKRIRRLNEEDRLPPLMHPAAVRFASPMKNRTVVTSPFGPRWRDSHEGVDLEADRGDDILAVESGRVIRAGPGNGYGKMVRIRHAGGFETVYAHLGRIKVREGERVGKGELVGKAGSSGTASGVHLHFELLQDGRPVNPMNFIRF